MRRLLRFSVQLILLFFIYFASARLGLALDAVSGFAALVWLPSGISLAAVLLFGFEMWPAIALAAFLINLLQGAPYPVAFSIGVGNTLEAVVGAMLLKRWGFNKSLTRLKDILLLILLATPVAGLISATIGTASLVLGKITDYKAFLSTWTAWWIGDMMSMLVVTPFILSWKKFPKRINTERLPEAFILACCLVGVSLLIFLFSKNPAFTYLIFPPLMWACLRFSQREAISATVLLIAIAIWGSAHGLGPFAADELSKSLLQLQGYLAVVAATALTVSAIASERTELEQRKDDIISIVSHELKSPITSVQMYAQILEKTFQRKKDKKPLVYIERIETQTKRLTNLINDLLDVSKIQSGKIEFTMSVFSLNSLIAEIVSSIKDTTSTHKIVLRLSAKNDIVYSDRDRISQVLTNLLTNAIKYSSKGKRVIVRSYIGSDKAIVSIRDYGIGIADKDRNKIFQRYYRANESIPGFGIGLYISNEIIMYLGGEMWVESKKGKGSTFYFSVPISKRTV